VKPEKLNVHRIAPASGVDQPQLIIVIPAMIILQMIVFRIVIPTGVELPK
jgi:hypothetical protein